MTPYHYYRDHDCWAWGVRDARDGHELATGLDKCQATAIADLLNGEIRGVMDFLTDIIDCYPSGQTHVGHKPPEAP